jgi:hypothetical protein
MINFKFTFPNDTVKIIQAKTKATAIRIMNRRLTEKQENERFCIFETINPTEFILIKYFQTS